MTSFRGSYFILIFTYKFLWHYRYFNHIVKRLKKNNSFFVFCVPKAKNEVILFSHFIYFETTRLQ